MACLSNHQIHDHLWRKFSITLKDVTINDHLTKNISEHYLMNNAIYIVINKIYFLCSSFTYTDGTWVTMNNNKPGNRRIPINNPLCKSSVGEQGKTVHRTEVNDKLEAMKYELKYKQV